MRRQESRSILGASIIRNYFRHDVDPNGALTQVQALALAEIPNLPPGTLPPIVLPYDPTGTVPACIMAVDSSSCSGSRHRVTAHLRLLQSKSEQAENEPDKQRKRKIARPPGS